MSLSMYSYADYDSIMDDLSERVVDEIELEAYGYLVGTNDQVKMEVCGEQIPITEDALAQYLNLVFSSTQSVSPGAKFATQCVNSIECEEPFNTITYARWLERYDKEKSKPLIIHLTKDKFTPFEGEIRAVTTSAFTRMPDYDVGDFAGRFKGFEFKSGSLWREYTSFNFVCPARRAEVKKGDMVDVGLSFLNSEFAKRSLNISLYSWRLVCGNGATTRTASLFSKKLVHRQRSEASFYDKFSANARSLERIIPSFQRYLVGSSSIPVGLAEDTDLLELPVTKDFAKVSLEDRRGILKAYKDQLSEEKPISNMSRYDLWNASTRYVRDNPDKERSDVLIRGINSLLLAK